MEMKTKKELAIGGGALLAAGALVAGAALAMKAMTRIPKGVEAVKPFDINKYMGKWYEIARMDYIFEKNLSNCTAEYTMDENEEIHVVNRGYNYKKNRMEESEGKAQFVDSPDEARLKVSFWGPFYSAYNVIAIDKDYKNALVAGKDFKHLWLLSRESTMPEETIEYFLQQAESFGYDTSKLIWVDQNEFEVTIENVEAHI